MDEEFLEKEIILKKTIGLIAVLALCLFPVMAQDSPPATVPVSATFTSGCLIQIVPGMATWTLPVPMVNGELEQSDEGVQPVIVSWRLPPGNSISLVVETVTDLVGGSATLPMENYVKHIWTGGITADSFLPPSASAQVEFFTDVDTNGLVNAFVEFWITNNLIFADTYVGEIAYTVIDVV